MNRREFVAGTAAAVVPMPAAINALVPQWQYQTLHCFDSWAIECTWIEHGDGNFEVAHLCFVR